jgi:hypothetical protein
VKLRSALTLGTEAGGIFDTLLGLVRRGLGGRAAPHPLPNGVFMRVLRKAAGVPFGLPATRWMLELGAIAMRTETELILKSRRVVPARLLASGFRFRYPHWDEAAAELCARWSRAAALNATLSG